MIPRRGVSYVWDFSLPTSPPTCQAACTSRPLAAGSCDGHAGDTLMSASSAATRATLSPTVHEFTVADVEYSSHDGGPLLLRLFEPKGVGPFPLMIDLHGGAWCGQDRTSDAMY